MKNSKLVPVGILFIIVSFFSQSVNKIVKLMQDGLLKGIVFLSADLFRLCFFIGTTFLIIGILRNKRLKNIVNER